MLLTFLWVLVQLEYHQRSWWIVNTSPTKGTPIFGLKNPTDGQSVDGSYLTSVPYHLSKNSLINSTAA
jgi:hypothetical protein